MVLYRNRFRKVKVLTLEAGLIAQPAKGGRMIADNPTKAAKAAENSAPTKDALSVVMERLDEDQALEVVSIDLEGKSDVADAMVIASGRSQRHVGAIADKLSRDLKEAGYKSVSIEGLPACDWVLIDAGDVVVHIFRPEVRSFYNLERIWAPELFAETSENGDFTPATDAFSVASTDQD